MKRILLCAGALTLLLAQPISAEAELDVNVRAVDNFVTVEAELGEENANEQVTIEVKNSEEEYNFINQGYTDEDGNIKFEYYNVGDTDTYTVKVTAGESNIVLSEDYTIINEATALSLTAIWNAKNSADEIKAATEENLSYLPFNTTYYNMIADNAEVYKLYMADNDAKVQNIGEVIEYLNYYTFAALNSEKRDVELVRTMLSDKAVNQYLGVDDLPMVGKKSVEELFDNGDLEKIYSDMAGLSYKKADEVKTAYGAALISGYIKRESAYTNIEKVLKAYDDGDMISIDMAAYNKHNNQKGVITALKKKDCTSYKKLEKAFEEALSESKKTGSGGSGGGGGSSFSPAATAPKPTTAPIVDETESKYERFSDMAGVEWAENAVNELRKIGVISGISETEFCPMRSITRAEAVKMFTALFGLEAADEKLPFDDLKESHWGYKYIAAAYRDGIVNGKGENRFEPDATITRNEIIVIAYKMIKKYGLEYGTEVGAAFTDEVAPWASEAANFCKKAGIIKGRTDNSFDGGAPLTRAEAAVILYKVYGANNFNRQEG